MGEQLLKQGFEAQRLAAQIQDLLGDLLHLLNIVPGQRGDVRGGFRVGGDEHPGLQGLYHLQGLKIGGHVIDEADLVFLQRLFAGQAVRKVYHLIRRPEANHVEEMAGEGKKCKPFRQHVGVRGRASLSWARRNLWHRSLQG